MTLAARADAATTRDALAAAARLIRRTDLLIAAAHLDVHGKPHLKPVSDRLAGLAASLPSVQDEKHLADVGDSQPLRSPESGDSLDIITTPGGTP